jgi:hypothetical protein
VKALRGKHLAGALLALLSLALVGPRPAAAQAPIYKGAVLNNNLVGMTVTNYGFWGNNFASRSPSLEYPLGSAFEHLVRGGLWVGGQALDANGTFLGVTTGTVDGSTNDGNSASATEFTPVSSGLEFRTTQQTGPLSAYYSTHAISEWDAFSTYTDVFPTRAKNNSEDHRPMGLEVTQYNYEWSFSNYAHILFFHILVKNVGPPLANVWLGAYNEFASGYKNAYSGWPPSVSNGGSEGSWFSKKWIVYEDSLRMMREHYCLSSPPPTSCNLPHVPYWVGLQMLGVTKANAQDTTTVRTTFMAWAYGPSDSTRQRDDQRYALLSLGSALPIGADLAPGLGDPVTLQGMGPCPVVLTGESIALDFAVLGAPDEFTLRKRAHVAQQAYDLNYIVPVPPPSPNLKIVARDAQLDLYWDDEAERTADPTSPAPGNQDFEGYRVYLSEDRLDLKLIAQFDKKGGVNDTTGYNTGFAAIDAGADSTRFEGHVYQHKYTVRNLRDGFKYYAAVTSYDLGSTETESLESGTSLNKTMAIPAPGAGERPGEGVVVFPNPYRVEARWDAGQFVRDHYLWFANLPEKCIIRVYTLSGDIVLKKDFDGSSYQGEGARGIYDPKRELDVAAPTMSGRMFGWDMITDQDQAVATGLYLYSVEDKATGKRTLGKVLIVKSDREN